MMDLKNKLKAATEKEEYESASMIKKELDKLQQIKDRLSVQQKKKEQNNTPKNK
jgi:hypothetical protein